jgi:hypothetical protein
MTFIPPSTFRLFSRLFACHLRWKIFLLLLLGTLLPQLSAQKGVEIPWIEAGILAPARWSGPEEKALTMLVEESERRTGVRWAVTREWEKGPAPLIVLVSDATRDAVGLPPAWRQALPEAPAHTESFAIKATQLDGRDVLFVVGHDARGVLYGVGGLLRKMTLLPDRADLARDFQLTTAPVARWRGHQLGYRPKTNSYDGWDVADWERYIRDLVIFGVNAIELVPPRSDDAATSPHFSLPPLRMMQQMSHIIADYGLECWIWYPAIDKDYTATAPRQKIFAEWEEVFSALPRIDAVFVPGGDPGSTPPGVLMDLLENQARILRQHHPQAGMWVSPQGFSAKWLQEWLGMVAKQPAWLTGVVYGPWNRLALPALRDAVPKRYPLRLYPDITHSFLCQFPVPDWDSALASTLGREPINPRPLDMANIVRLQLRHADGFISYSEGCNDDVNKAVWSALSWGPETDVKDILRDYGRYYLSPLVANDFAEGLLALERNWRGPLTANRGVEETLAKFQTLEKSASPALRRNWRFQQALYRAYFDAYVRRRLIAETDQEKTALAILAQPGSGGALAAMASAEELLFAPSCDPALRALRTRIFQLAEALFQSVKMQLSVPLYSAIAVPRGANLDTVDLPLNNRGWLKTRFAEIRKLPDEPQRLSALRTIVSWTDAGPGGFYNDLGNLKAQPNVVSAGDPATDPEYRRHPLITHSIRTGTTFENWRAAWWDHLSAFYGSAVELRFDGLDATATYEVRVVYVPTFLPAEIRLEANDDVVIHDAVVLNKESSQTLQPQAFAIPQSATRDGSLRLRWTVNPNAGELVGFGQIGEVWLVKKTGAPPPS